MLHHTGTEKLAIQLNCDSDIVTKEKFHEIPIVERAFKSIFTKQRKNLKKSRLPT